MNNTLVSIIVPCYNQAQYLNKALESVLDQTYTHWECIIVNDGSPDHTEDIAKKWIEKDNRFFYFKKENNGVSSARNFGIEKSKGEYLQFLDADDYLEKDKLKLSLIEIQKDTRINIVISNFRMFTSNPKETTEPFCQLSSQSFSFENLLYHWNIYFSIQIQCGFFHSSLFETIRFPENLTAQEDWIVWVSIFKAGCISFFLDKPLALYRINPNSRMHKSIVEDQIKAWEYLSCFLSKDEYQKFSMFLISRYYKSNMHYKNRWINTLNSNSHQTGLLIKKILRTFGILKPCKRIFRIILSFKK